MVDRVMSELLQAEIEDMERLSDERHEELDSREGGTPSGRGKKTRPGNSAREGRPPSLESEPIAEVDCD